jgi:hypothetical protein
MSLNLKTLTQDLLRIAEAAAPLVGLADELAAGKELVGAIEGLVTNARDVLDSEDHAALSAALDKLADAVNARADAVQERLRG